MALLWGFSIRAWGDKDLWGFTSASSHTVFLSRSRCIFLCSALILRLYSEELAEDKTVNELKQALIVLCWSTNLNILQIYDSEILLWIKFVLMESPQLKESLLKPKFNNLGQVHLFNCRVSVLDVE